VTKEPVPWFDLVLACGLADVRAVSLEDLQEGKLSVRDVARGLLPRFEKTFGRELVGLDGEGEVGELRELVERAESDAKEENERRGGWRSGPDLTKRVL
jgi:lipoyl(octanoyl) transferase